MLNILSIDEGEEYFAPVYWVRSQTEDMMRLMFDQAFLHGIIHDGVILSEEPFGLPDRVVGSRITFAPIGKLIGA